MQPVDSCVYHRMVKFGVFNFHILCTGSILLWIKKWVRRKSGIWYAINISFHFGDWKFQPLKYWNIYLFFSCSYIWFHCFSHSNDNYLQFADFGFVYRWQWYDKGILKITSTLQYDFSFAVLFNIYFKIQYFFFNFFLFLNLQINRLFLLMFLIWIGTGFCCVTTEVVIILGRANDVIHMFHFWLVVDAISYGEYSHISVIKC